MKNPPLPYLLLLVSLSPSLFANTQSAIRDILDVDSEGRGNSKASKAWSELASGGADSIPTLLKAMNDANGLAANLNPGTWQIGTLAPGTWALGLVASWNPGTWALGPGSWAIGLGPWVLGPGP